MAIQKHNTYYDASKPNSGIYFYDQNGDSKQLPIDKICSAGNGIDINGNTITYTGKDEPVLIGDSNITATSSISGNHTQWNLFVNSTPVVTDTSLTGENGITAHTTDVSGQWIIGLESNSANYIKKIPDILEDVNALTSKSANWESSYDTLTSNSANWKVSYNTLTSNSANWESSYNTLKSNSGDWLKEDALAGLVTKAELNTASSVLTAQTDYLSGVINNKLDTTAFSTVSGQFAIKTEVKEEFEQTSAWAIETFQPKGDYLSASEKYLSANALNDLSGNWNSVYNTVETNSGNWENSYTALTSTSATWNNHSALSASKLDKSAFEGWSANADVTEYSGVSPISINEHKVSIDLSEYYKNTETSGKDELNTRFDPIEADLDILKENSAHNVVESKNDYIKVYSGTNEFELEFLSGDLATKTWVKEQLGDFGGYVPCEGIGTDKHPNVNNPDPKKMYLVPKDDTTEPDRYYNWIVTGIDTTGWLCIGDTSIDLTPYVKISDISIVSGNWNTAYSYVTANSADIAEASATAIDVNNTVNTYSANWQESYNALTSTSANWNSVYDDINANSATWNDTNTTLSDNSGKWEESYEALTSTSADWNTAYSYVTANSANIESVSSTVNANSGKWNEASAFSANSGKFVTSGGEIADTDLAYVLKKTGDNIAWSGIDLSDLGKIYPITSLTPDLVSATVSAMGETSGYVLSAKEPDPVEYFNISANKMSAWSGTYNDKDYYFISGAEIVGNNGISAEYDPATNSWEVGLEDYENIGFAKYNTSANTYTEAAVFDGYSEVLNLNSDKIALENDKLVLQPGLYHVDLQCLMSVTGNDNNYYSTVISTSPAAASITQIIDASYAHNETIDLSFDIRITNTDTTLDISVNDFQIGGTYTITNLNIHEIITMPSKIEGNAGNYAAGEAIDITNDTISVKYEPTSGIGLTNDNKIFVKLGEGLKFDTSGAAAGSLSLNNVTQEVVETVQTIANDLDEKVTSNFPPAMITIADCDIAAYRNNGALYGNLFNVSINSVIEIDRTKLGFYIYQVDQTKRVIFGLYEYQPDYPRYTDDDPTKPVSAYGRTVALCDTGVVTIPGGTNGFCEYPIKNLNNTIGTPNEETRPSLKSSCMYYATIYMDSTMSEGGLKLGGFSGYTPPFNQIKPGLNLYQNNINCALNDAAYSADISFNDFGFSWKYDNYPNHYTASDTTTASMSIQEKNDGYRFYMQIRNTPSQGN